MNKKAIFKILAIFILGMAIGAFVMGGIVKHRIDRVHRHHAGKGFSEALIHLTEVEGEEKERLIQLGTKYGEQLKELGKEHFQKRAELLEELEKEGNVFLKGTKKEKFQRHLHRMKEGPKRGKEGKKN